MICDCNAFLGNWAFRRLRRNDVPGLLAMMDRFGVARAGVASADAILYKDTQPANDALYEMTRGYETRFWRYATINPAYAGWEHDLNVCAERGFRGIRIYPYYQGYEEDAPELGRLFEAAAEADLPVTVPMRVVDVRQRHWMDTEKNLNLEALLNTLEAHPRATLLLTEAMLGWGAGNAQWARLRKLNFYIEMSRLSSVIDNSLGMVVKELGADRVLFGTGFPFKTPSPAFLKMDLLLESEAVKEALYCGNALRLFREI